MEHLRLSTPLATRYTCVQMGICGSTVAAATTSCDGPSLSHKTDRRSYGCSPWRSVWPCHLHQCMLSPPPRPQQTCCQAALQCGIQYTCCHGKLWHCQASESYRHDILSVRRHATDGYHSAVLCAPLQGLLQAPSPLPSTTACPSAPDSGTASAGRALTCTWQQGAVYDCD
jgi:hypothetical protein